MRRAGRSGYRILAVLFLAGAALQFFLAGLGVFGAAGFEVHATVGTILGLASVVLFVLAAILAVSGELAWRWTGDCGAVGRSHGRPMVLGGGVLGGGPGPGRTPPTQRSARCSRSLISGPRALILP